MTRRCFTSEDSVLSERNSNVGSKNDLARCQSFCDGGVRDRIKETLQLFRETLGKVEKENRAKPRIERSCSYTIASNILKRNGKWVNTNKCLGVVPGVEIGDEFQSKAELGIVGLHHRRFCGIDYLVQKGVALATSVVSTKRYANKMEASDVLVYIGEGGNPQIKRGPLKDQKLERGNLALKNSMDHKTVVRVIRCRDIHGQRGITKSVYVYGGLYLVETFRQERGEFGKLVFKFFLRELSGQHKMSKQVTSASKSIFNGERESPIGGCDCVFGCSEQEDCSCRMKNGGKMPYDSNECLVKIRPLIYECGPCCKCSLSCRNRVSQRGPQQELELFKGKFCRSGVRSKSYIPKGSFICEYLPRIGFLGKENQEENIGIFMDECRNAEMGRYISNSSCPNLYGQQIMNGHGDEPHMMLFTTRNISPSEELTIGFKNQVLNSFK